MRRLIVLIFLPLTLTTFGFIYYLQPPDNTVHRDKNSQFHTTTETDLDNLDLTKSCSIKLPKLFDLQIVNDVWQYQELQGGRSLHLFSAYLDQREWLGDVAMIRIMVMYSVYKDESTIFYCQIWYENESMVVAAEELLWIWVHGWGGDRIDFHYPYIVSCPVPRGDRPILVSVVEKPCDLATNSLKVVIGESEKKKKDFAVCVKGLNFPEEDHSDQLVEWIEAVRLLGADTINFYQFSVHANMEKVLEYYKRQNFVTVDRVALVGKYSNRPRLQNKFLKERNLERRLQEVIPYNDCFYKNFAQYRFVVLLDIDEIIVPQNSTWKSLVDQLEQKYPNKSSYVAQNVYFFNSDDYSEEVQVPSYMHMLRHVRRAANHTKPGFYVKAFHNSEEVVALHNHFALHCNGFCRSQPIDVKSAQLQHYRENCVRTVRNCDFYKENTVIDKRLWMFKDLLVGRVTRTLKELQLLDKFEKL